MAEYVEYRLGDIADVRWGDTNTTKASYTPIGFAAYSASGHDGFLPNYDYDRTGIVVSAIGSECGKVWLAKGQWSCIKNTIRVFSTAPVVRTEYLYWLMKREDFFPKRGSGQPFISQGDARDCRVLLPDLLTQDAVCEVLGALDDKIGLNRQMNETLEAAAQAIFRDWFIDFGPVRRKLAGATSQVEIMGGVASELQVASGLENLFPGAFSEDGLPLGWRLGSLKEFWRIFDSKRVPVSGAERAKRPGQYPYYGAAAVMGTIDDYLFDGIFVLVGEDGTVVRPGGLGVTQYVWGKFWVNNHAHVIQGAGSVSTEQLLLYFDQQPVQPYVTGAVQMKLSQGRMGSMPFVFAGNPTCEAFGRIVAPLFSRIRAAADESRTLAEARDYLLPRLMGGEVGIGQIQLELEAAE